MLTVHQSDSLWKETVYVSGCFGVQSSVAPSRGEEWEQAVSRVRWLCSDVPSGQVLDGGQVGPNNSFCSLESRCCRI